MKKNLLSTTLVLAVFLAISLVVAEECATIQSGTIKTSDDRTIMPGYDIWGYNYQGHMFNGGYCDAYQDAAWCQSYKDINLQMKWNDAWLSNTDCNNDNLLDRHNGYTSYIGSGAWLTNHMSGGSGKDKWTYFVKIVAKPTEDFSCESIGGYSIWNEFCVIQEQESGAGPTTKANIPGLGKGLWM